MAFKIKPSIELALADTGRGRLVEIADLEGIVNGKYAILLKHAILLGGHHPWAKTFLDFMPIEEYRASLEPQKLGELIGFDLKACLEGCAKIEREGMRPFCDKSGAEPTDIEDIAAGKYAVILRSYPCSTLGDSYNKPHCKRIYGTVSFVYLEPTEKILSWPHMPEGCELVGFDLHAYRKACNVVEVENALREKGLDELTNLPHKLIDWGPEQQEFVDEINGHEIKIEKLHQTILTLSPSQYPLPNDANQWTPKIIATFYNIREREVRRVISDRLSKLQNGRGVPITINKTEMERIVTHLLHKPKTGRQIARQMQRIDN